MLRYSLILSLFILLLWWLQCKKVARIKASTFLQTAQTGDLLYFRSRKRPWYFKAVAPMTHIGVVLRYGDRPFVLEMHQVNDAPPGYPNDDGPHVYPLEVRVTEALYQEGGDWDVFHSKYRGPPVAPTVDLSWAFPPAYIPYNYSYIADELSCHAALKMRRVDTSQKMHCGNYAAWALKKLGILPSTTRIDCLFPLEVKNLAPYDPLLKIVT